MNYYIRNIGVTETCRLVIVRIRSSKVRKKIYEKRTNKPKYYAPNELTIPKEEKTVSKCYDKKKKNIIIYNVVVCDKHL